MTRTLTRNYMAKAGDLVQTTSRGWKSLYKVQQIQGSFTAILEDCFTREFKGNWPIRDLKVVQACPLDVVLDVEIKVECRGFEAAILESEEVVAVVCSTEEAVMRKDINIEKTHEMVPLPLCLFQETQVKLKTGEQPGTKEVATDKILDKGELAASKTTPFPLHLNQAQVGEHPEKKEPATEPVAQTAKQEDELAASTIGAIRPMNDIKILAGTGKHVETRELTDQALSRIPEAYIGESKTTSLPFRLKSSEHVELQNHHLPGIKFHGNEKKPKIEERIVLIRTSSTSASKIYSPSHAAFESRIAIQE
jgi:hypothetical protein